MIWCDSHNDASSISRHHFRSDDFLWFDFCFINLGECFTHWQIRFNVLPRHCHHVYACDINLFSKGDWILSTHSESERQAQSECVFWLESWLKGEREEIFEMNQWWEKMQRQMITAFWFHMQDFIRLLACLLSSSWKTTANQLARRVRK